MRPERVWVGIAAAIIEQALNDRKDAMDDLLNKPGDMIALGTIHECDDFFDGEWCMTLQDICGISTEDLDRLREEE